MKSLKDYSDEINKCSKCGLCQAVCPLYKLTGNECAVSKGKFVMLDGVVKGDLTLNKNIDKYLEMCLKCGKCMDFCPSGIDVLEIFRTAKHEYIKDKFEGKFVGFLQSRAVFENLLTAAEKINSVKILPDKENAKKNILFFKGCANKLVPAGEKAMKQIFSKLPYNLREGNFDCCGVPYAASGNLERYEETVKRNSEIIKNSECDTILTDCASCADAISKYPNLNKRVMNFSDFISEENIKFKSEKPLRVTFHKPCHLKNYAAVKNIFANCENVEYAEMPEFDECCGFSGQFAITNRKLSSELTKKKIENALSVNPDIIITACPACLAGLKLGMMRTKTSGKRSVKIMNLTEFLAGISILAD